MDGAQIASKLELAFLKADSRATVAELKASVQAVQELNLRALCTSPVLAGTVKKNFPTVRVCAVVSYPLGSDSLAAKVFAAQELIELGIDELDIVCDLFALLNDNRRKLEQEARQLGELCRAGDVICKAIIETPILTEPQMQWAAEVLRDSPVHCVKTSTGYHREPTSLDHVRLLRSVLGHEKQIKAAGGIDSLYDALAMLEAGADILGSSAAADIVAEAVAQTPSL
jgi:deoxyribose-phosphate aldolase